MSIFQHRYSACANELATTCYYLLLNVSCAQILHKYCTNIARLHKRATQHNWATRHTLGKQEQLSNKREVWNTHGSPGHGVCVQIAIKYLYLLWVQVLKNHQGTFSWMSFSSYFDAYLPWSSSSGFIVEYWPIRHGHVTHFSCPVRFGPPLS